VVQKLTEREHRREKPKPREKNEILSTGEGRGIANADKDGTEGPLGERN